MTEIRTLEPGDEQRLETFLRDHAESSMFLRANVRRAGLADRGQLYQATYTAALDGGRIVAVAAHSWRGSLILQAPVHLEAVVGHAVERSGRSVSGFLGPWDQVVAARAALGLARARTRQNSREILYSLPLADLVTPRALADGTVHCRHPRNDELPLLVTWRAGYNAEANGMEDSADARALARAEIEHWNAEGIDFVLARDDEPVAYSIFNAALPDSVQIGAVWTPPALRSRGYARCVVAGSLLMARAGAGGTGGGLWPGSGSRHSPLGGAASSGVERAVLFTGETNVAAQRAYEALGFRAIGDYGLVFFA